MSIAELMPLIKKLPNADKFKLIKVLIDQVEPSLYEATKAPEKMGVSDIIGIASGDNDDISRRHDEYLY